MKIVFQRVQRSCVRINGTTVGSIGQGALLLIGVHANDTLENAGFLAAKCADLRVFSDEEGKMNLSLKDVQGEALVVSQFTLLGDCAKGRRPSFINAAPPEKAKSLYEYFVEQLRRSIKKVETGVFGAMMEVELVNDGPVTMLLEK